MTAAMDAADITALTQSEMATFAEGAVLGRGSYGVVRAALLSTGKVVAVKIVPVQHDEQRAHALTCVRQEVNLISTLRHPNIIRFYGSRVVPSRQEIYIFMELAAHGSLSSLARKFGALSERHARRYTRQILHGLAYLHAHHIIHRDVKGDNVLIDAAGTARLADFGCSKALAGAVNRSRAGCGTLVGSPYWMAPEVIRNEPYGTKADVWSVGCTVVEMLNGGEAPWSEAFESPFAAMYHIGNSDAPPSNIPPVSDACSAFLWRCFARDVARRPSVEALLGDPWLAVDADDATAASSTDLTTPVGTGTTPGSTASWSELLDGGGSRRGASVSLATDGSTMSGGMAIASTLGANSGAARSAAASVRAAPAAEHDT